MNAPNPPEQAAPRLTVYYDGACPLCSLEIATYRGLHGADSVCWVDVSDTRSPGPGPDLTREAALQRFHVRTADGTLVSGGAAFLRVWAALPGLRWLAALAGHPPVSWLLEPAYRLFLRLRPLLSRSRRRNAPPV